MTKWSRLTLPSLALLAAGLASGGCGPTTNDNQAGPPPPPGGPGGPGGPPSELRQAMSKIGGRPGPPGQSGQLGLASKIDDALKANPPAWDDLASQTKDLTEQAAKVRTALGQNDPPKGTKASWDQDAAAFAAVAADLDAAAQAKDLDKAKAAQTKLNQSCGDCHRAHRRGPGG